MGSVRVPVDADTGQVLERIDYDAYSRTTRDTNPGLQPFGFKGALAGPVAQGAGLVWMGVRAYQPPIARFTTPEPAGLAAVWNDPDALANDPLSCADIDGLLPLPIDHGTVFRDEPDATVYYDPKHDLTVVLSKTTGRIVTAHRGRK